MKKISFIPILLLVLFSCSPDEETQAPTNTVEASTPEPEIVVVQYTLPRMKQATNEVSEDLPLFV